MPPNPFFWFIKLNKYLVRLSKWLHDLRALLVKVDWKKLTQDYPAGPSANVPAKPPEWP